MGYVGRPKEFWSWWEGKDKKVMKEIVGNISSSQANEIISFLMKNDYTNAMKAWDRFESEFVDTLPSDVLPDLVRTKFVNFDLRDLAH